ncbi:MAG: VWA domain-containing protein [Verrucomicrobiales bacterium]
MSFHQPLWLLLLIPLPFLAFLRVWSHVSAGKGGKTLVSPRLRNELIVGASQGLRWAVFSLNLIALGFLMIAMARPQWGIKEADTISEGRNLIVAIDTSRSMLATDLQPDRMTRAKLAAQDIIESLPEDRIGLIAFAGKAFLQAPLTVDHDAVLESIAQLDSEIIPRGGTNIEAPVQLALDTFFEAESKESALIIFSDGEDLEGEEEIDNLKEKALELGMIVVAIGVGTEKGSIIPEPDDKGRPRPGVFIRDDAGAVVRTRLDPVALQKISVDSGAGVYVNLGSASSITSLVGNAIDSLSATRLEDQARRVPIERFMWPLSIAIFLWVIAFLLPASSRAFVEKRAKRFQLDSPPTLAPLKVKGRSITAWIAAALLPLTSGIADDSKKESAGFSALNNGNYEEAISAYETEIPAEESSRKRSWLNMGLGTAAYLEGDYEKAQLKFGKVLAEAEDQSLVEQAHFNMANTGFRKGQITMGWDEKSKAAASSSEMPMQIADEATRNEVRTQWESAREHYEAALDLNPDNSKARRNTDLVNGYLQYLQQIEEQEKQKEEEEQKKEKEKEEEKDDEEKEDDQEKKDEEKDENGKDEKDQDKGDQEKEQDQNQDPNEDGKPKDQNEDGKPDDQNQDGKPDDPKEDESEGKEEPADKKPGEDENGNPQDQKPEDGNQDQGEEKPLSPEEQGKAPEGPDPDGDLKAKPEQAGKQKPLSPQQMQEAAAQQAKNPNTGYSPSEARKLLRDLSDETLDVKPIYEVPTKAEKFRNW